jgi:Co/Zn/Cd efflux system component
MLLFRHRSDDLNMRSTWLCSRNDIVANLSVLLAAAGVGIFDSGWPDILVGAAIAALFLRSAFTVLSESFTELQKLKSRSVTAA